MVCGSQANHEAVLAGGGVLGLTRLLQSPEAPVRAAAEGALRLLKDPVVRTASGVAMEQLQQAAAALGIADVAGEPAGRGELAAR